MFKYSYHQQSMKSQNNSWGVQPLSMDDGLELAQYTMIDFRHGTKVNIISNFAIVEKSHCQMLSFLYDGHSVTEKRTCFWWYTMLGLEHLMKNKLSPPSYVWISDCENEEWKTIGCISSFQVPTRHWILCAAGFKAVLALDSIAV